MQALGLCFCSPVTGDLLRLPYPAANALNPQALGGQHVGVYLRSRQGAVKDDYLIDDERVPLGTE